MICHDADDNDPFLQADNVLELGDEGCSSNEFACGDDDLPVCAEMDDDNWQSVFLDELTNDPEKEEGEEDSDDETEDDSAESGDVEGATVESWKERLPEIVQGYEKDDIWNMDETGLFWRALPDKGFGQKSKQCKGGKKMKQWLTIAFFVTATGRKSQL